MDNQIRKLIRDNKVGIIISDSKWYTSHGVEQLLFLPELIETLESEEYNNTLSELNKIEKQVSELKFYLNSTGNKSPDKVLQRTNKLSKAIIKKSEVELTLYTLIKKALLSYPLITDDPEDNVYYVRYAEKNIYIPLGLKVKWVSLNTYFRVIYDCEYNDEEYLEIFDPNEWMKVEE